MTNATPTADPTDPATWDRNGADLHHAARVQAARDAKLCACGHLNVSHGYGTQDGPTWPDGSRIGRGPCGWDRDRRNHATGWRGDPCPCVEFKEAAR